MSTSHEDITLIKYLPQNEGIFRRIKENIPGDRGRIGVRTMCHTRWTIKVDASMSSINSNGTLLRSTRDDVKDVDRADTDMKVRIHGITTLRIILSELGLLLKHGNILS